MEKDKFPSHFYNPYAIPIETRAETTLGENETSLAGRTQMAHIGIENMEDPRCLSCEIRSKKYYVKLAKRYRVKKTSLWG